MMAKRQYTIEEVNERPADFEQRMLDWWADALAATIPIDSRLLLTSRLRPSHSRPTDTA
jgi:hypothetical protein